MTDQLERVAEEIKAGRPSPRVSVREFLSWFGAQRRGYWIVRSIRHEMRKLGIETTPDFEITYIDNTIAFQSSDVDNTKGLPEPTHNPHEHAPEQAVEIEGVAKDAALIAAMEDPTYRISKLAAANNPVVAIAPNGSLGEAATLLMANDFSQLPVMTSEREVKGIITWKSLGQKLALSAEIKEAREAMIPHKEIRSDSSIFEAIPIITSHDYVLVRGDDNRIVGIVTASDLSHQFLMTAEPFLLLGEIENLLRQIIASRFLIDEMKEAKDPADEGREINVVSDLGFGEYIRLLDHDVRWQKLGLALDRKTFCKTLDGVRQIRNDVMHFDPDGIPPRQLGRLRDCASFLKSIQPLVGTPLP